ncbi:MAG: hypothetical protein KDD53_02800 [Bdellovibrionales bacterium]|nr:hypothetical protein [Bdellovibrionales bacterium]
MSTLFSLLRSAERPIAEAAAGFACDNLGMGDFSGVISRWIPSGIEDSLLRQRLALFCSIFGANGSALHSAEFTRTIIRWRTFEDAERRVDLLSDPNSLSEIFAKLSPGAFEITLEKVRAGLVHELERIAANTELPADDRIFAARLLGQEIEIEVEAPVSDAFGKEATESELILEESDLREPDVSPVDRPFDLSGDDEDDALVIDVGRFKGSGQIKITPTQPTSGGTPDRTAHQRELQQGDRAPLPPPTPVRGTPSDTTGSDTSVGGETDRNSPQDLEQRPGAVDQGGLRRVDVLSTDAPDTSIAGDRVAPEHQTAPTSLNQPKEPPKPLAKAVTREVDYTAPIVLHAGVNAHTISFAPYWREHPLLPSAQQLEIAPRSLSIPDLFLLMRKGFSRLRSGDPDRGAVDEFLNVLTTVVDTVASGEAAVPAESFIPPLVDFIATYRRNPQSVPAVIDALDSAVVALARACSGPDSRSPAYVLSEVTGYFGSRAESGIAVLAPSSRDPKASESGFNVILQIARKYDFPHQALYASHTLARILDSEELDINDLLSGIPKGKVLDLIFFNSLINPDENLLGPAVALCKLTASDPEAESSWRELTNPVAMGQRRTNLANEIKRLEREALENPHAFYSPQTRSWTESVFEKVGQVAEQEIISRLMELSNSDTHSNAIREQAITLLKIAAETSPCIDILAYYSQKDAHPHFEVARQILRAIAIDLNSETFIWTGTNDLVKSLDS